MFKRVFGTVRNHWLVKLTSVISRIKLLSASVSKWVCEVSSNPRVLLGPHRCSQS